MAHPRRDARNNPAGFRAARWRRVGRTLKAKHPDITQRLADAELLRWKAMMRVRAVAVIVRNLLIAAVVGGVVWLRCAQ